MRTLLFCTVLLVGGCSSHQFTSLDYASVPPEQCYNDISKAGVCHQNGNKSSTGGGGGGGDSGGN